MDIKDTIVIDKRKRYLYLDIIKIVSCFLVIVNHTAGTIFMDRAPSFTWFAGLTYFFISKPAVPLFLMASGAVLIGKQDSYKTKERIVKFVSVLFIFSLFYVIEFNKIQPFTITGFIQETLKTNQTTALWYMYLYIGILFILPFLQKMVKDFSETDFIYFIMLTIVFLGTIPLANHFFVNFNISAHFKNVIFSTYIGLFVSGYYIHKFIEPTKKMQKYSIIVYLVLLLFQIFCIYSEYAELGNEAYMFYDNRVMITITVSSFALFYLSKDICTRYNFSDFTIKVISFLSSCTFGIYLISDFYINKMSFIYYDLSQTINPVLASIILQILVFGAGLVTTLIFKKIPYLKKLL